MDSPKFYVNKVLSHAGAMVKVQDIKKDEDNSTYLYKVMPVYPDEGGNHVEGEPYLVNEIELEVGYTQSDIDMKPVR